MTDRSPHWRRCDLDQGRDLMTEARGWQRLDSWLWCARFLRQRDACAELAASGLIRINRQPTDKSHARLRPGDVLTLPLHGRVRVVEVLALAERRGNAAAASLLYRELPEPGATQAGPCSPAGSAPYPA